MLKSRGSEKHFWKCFKGKEKMHLIVVPTIRDVLVQSKRFQAVPALYENLKPLSCRQKVSKGLINISEKILTLR